MMFFRSKISVEEMVQRADELFLLFLGDVDGKSAAQLLAEIGKHSQEGECVDFKKLAQLNAKLGRSVDGSAISVIDATLRRLISMQNASRDANDRAALQFYIAAFERVLDGAMSEAMSRGRLRLLPRHVGRRADQLRPSK